MDSEKKKISALITLIKRKGKDMMIEVTIENANTGKPITGLKIDDFTINGDDPRGHLKSVTEIKPGVYLPEIKDQFPGVISPKEKTSIGIFEGVVSKPIIIGNKLFDNV